MLSLSSATDSAFESPGPVAQEYYAFEKAAISYVERTGGRSIIGDDMGIGKTIEAIGWLNPNATKRPAIVITTAFVKRYCVNILKEWLIVAGFFLG